MQTTLDHFKRIAPQTTTALNHATIICLDKTVMQWRLVDNSDTPALEDLESTETYTTWVFVRPIKTLRIMFFGHRDKICVLNMCDVRPETVVLKNVQPSNARVGEMDKHAIHLTPDFNCPCGKPVRIPYMAMSMMLFEITMSEPTTTWTLCFPPEQPQEDWPATFAPCTYDLCECMQLRSGCVVSKSQ